MCPTGPDSERLLSRVNQDLQLKAPWGRPDPSLRRVFPASTAPGRSPGRDQGAGAVFISIHPQAGVEHVLGLASKQTSKYPDETPDVVGQFSFGKADPVAPALLAQSGCCMLGAGG